MKILVIGDSCTDIFRYGEVNRLAPEAPVPVIKPDREISNPGMFVLNTIIYFYE